MNASTQTVRSVKEEALAYVDGMEIPSTGWSLLRGEGSQIGNPRFLRRRKKLDYSLKEGPSYTKTVTECPLGSQMRIKLHKGKWKAALADHDLCPSPPRAEIYLNASRNALSLITVAADGQSETGEWFSPVGLDSSVNPDYVGEDVEAYREAKHDIREALLRKCGIE